VLAFAGVVSMHNVLLGEVGANIGMTLSGCSGGTHVDSITLPSL
jgi:hypothetical protein